MIETVIAKQNLTRDIEENVGEYLTYKQTKAVSETVTDVLQNYDVEEIKKGEICTDLLKDFLNAKKVEGKSPKTIERYSYMLEKVISGIGKPIPKIATADIREYFAEEKKRGISDRSLEGLRSICSSFFRWLKNEDLIRKNPISNIAPIKYKKEIKQPFSTIEIEKMKRMCDSLRDLVIICFLFCTGARISEVCALNRSDIDFDKKSVKVLGKGDKERIVFLDDNTVDLLKQYLQSRNDHDPCLFYGKRGRLTPGGIRAMLVDLEEDTEIPSIHPHRFRRTLATKLIRHGMPIQNVAYILGHSNVNTTMTYVCINGQDVENEYRRYM